MKPPISCRRKVNIPRLGRDWNKRRSVHLMQIGESLFNDKVILPLARLALSSRWVFGASLLWVFENSCVVEGRWTQKFWSTRLRPTASALWNWEIEGCVLTSSLLICLVGHGLYFVWASHSSCLWIFRPAIITRASEELSLVDKPVPTFEAGIRHWFAI